MNQYIKHNNQLQEVYSELGKEIDITQKEATKALRLHRDKSRLHMNAGTMESKDYLKSEDGWNTIDQKLKTLNQIKSILEKYINNSGAIEDIVALGKELSNYISIATDKQLHLIADTLKEYRNKLDIVDSELNDLIKLKAKPESDSAYIKETFLKACQKLDASIFEPLIDEDEYFEELDKYRFLQSMKSQFDYLKGLGLE